MKQSLLFLFIFLIAGSLSAGELLDVLANIKKTAQKGELTKFQSFFHEDAWNKAASQDSVRGDKIYAYYKKGGNSEKQKWVEKNLQEKIVKDTGFVINQVKGEGMIKNKMEKFNQKIRWDFIKVKNKWLIKDVRLIK